MNRKTVALLVVGLLVFVGMAFFVGMQVGNSVQNRSIPGCVPSGAPWCQVGYTGLNPDPWGVNLERWYEAGLERRQEVFKTWLCFGTIWLALILTFVGWLINRKIGGKDGR